MTPELEQEIARVLELDKKRTQEEWHACRNGECSCKALWSNDHPIATFECGEWGDSYPAIRHADCGGLAGTKVEAYMEKITYGEISENAARANLLFCKSAPTMVSIIRQLVEENLSLRSINKALSGTIESQKQTADAMGNRLKAQDGLLGDACGELNYIYHKSQGTRRARIKPLLDRITATQKGGE